MRVDEIRKLQRAEGPATVLAIGTATPPNCYHQSSFPDFYFRATKAVHPGGPKILDRVEERLGLEPEKLRPTRHVLAEYGNMWSGSVVFVLDEIRRRSVKNGSRTVGDGLDCGVLLGFGPGLTVETVVLRALI
ncbi:unnamed protein product [Linum tenue]|uniref:Chalcone/stilbene synthase C-terminal domain-containing protein n=1 Tax=Linum tenue TaxID=586396 RepID=A0AAV0GR86_9ROSI|nr:unnamed protein product [Linum tenue]